MDEFEILVGAQLAQGFDCAERDTAAAVAGQAAGLVQGEQALVFVHDGGSQAIQQCRWGFGLLAGFGQGHWRNPHDVAAVEPRIGLGALAIDPDLAAADELVDQAARRALELAEQEVVEALAIAVVCNGHGADASSGLLFGHWESVTG